MIEQTLAAVLSVLFVIECMFFKTNNLIVKQPAIESSPTEYESRTRRNSTIQKWVRFVELVLIMTLVLRVTSTRSVDIFLTRTGQISGLLLLLQIARIMSRRVISNLAVLITATTFQFVLCIPLFFLWSIESPGRIIGNNRAISFAISFSLFLLLFFLTLCILFIVTYLIKKLSKDDSNTFNSMPPLIFSEKWTRRILPVTILLSTVSFLLPLIFLITGSCDLIDLTIPGATLFLLFTAWILFRNRRLLHHPAAMWLIASVWFINMLAMLIGST